MITISFMSANFLAREAGYHLTGGWMAGDRATNAHFAPLESFATRFGELLRSVRAMGFQALDLWTAHLNSARVCPNPPARLTTCICCSVSKPRAMAMCSGVAQAGLRCAVHKSSA